MMVFFYRFALKYGECVRSSTSNNVTTEKDYLPLYIVLACIFGGIAMIVVIACLYTRSARGHARSRRRRGIRHDGGDGGGGWDGDGGGGGYGGDGGVVDMAVMVAVDLEEAMVEEVVVGR